MLDCSPHRSEFAARIASIRTLLDATHTAGSPTTPDISRETRGLCVVLLYAAYERLLVSLCRSILETANTLRVGNRRLKPGLRLFAAYRTIQAVNNASQKQIWRGKGIEVVNTLGKRTGCTISPDVFPTDGSHMKQGQVETFCEVFGIGPPGPILQDAWGRLNTVVSQRNDIAHGAKTSEEIGRSYTVGDLRHLVDIWELRWGEFINHVEAAASNRDFFRLSR